VRIGRKEEKKNCGNEKGEALGVEESNTLGLDYGRGKPENRPEGEEPRESLLVGESKDVWSGLSDKKKGGKDREREEGRIQARPNSCREQGGYINPPQGSKGEKIGITCPTSRKDERGAQKERGKKLDYPRNLKRGVESR